MATILTDVDDTLVQWSAAFTHWIRARGHQGSGKLLDHYCIPSWLGITAEEAQELVAAFQGDEGNFTTFKALHGAREGVERLVAAGHRLVAITACGDDPVLRAWRTRNLQALFGPVFDDLVLVPLHGSKGHILGQYSPTWWIEDNFGHAVSGAMCGHRSLLLDYPHNRTDDPRIRRVADWTEIAEVILTD
jgi:hypothetical protein